MPQDVAPQRRWGRHALQLLGLLLLVVLVVRLDWPLVLETLLGAEPRWLLLALGGLPPLIGLKAVRWWLLLRGQHLDMKLGAAYQAYFASLFIGFLTPGRLGEFVKVFYLRAQGTTTARGMSSVLADRLFDLYLLVAVGALALLQLVTRGTLLIVLALVVLLVLPLWLFLAARPFGWLRTQGRKLGRVGEPLFGEDGWLVDLRHGLRLLGGRSLLMASLLTILAYGVFFSQCYALAYAIDLPINYAQAVFAVALGSLITLAPISINGLGTRDAAIVAYLATVNVAPEAALSFSLLIFFTFTIVGGLIGAGAWLLNPVPLAVLRRASQPDVDHSLSA